MRTIDVIVIGGGQAGLAMSRSLSLRGFDHVVIERGSVGERWRSSTWDSLHLLTPNWLSSLPGLPHLDRDPDDFLSKDAFVGYLEAYAATHDAPVLAHTTVMRVDAQDAGYRVVTDRGVWRSRAIVIATGQCDIPALPPFAAWLDRRIESLHSSDYCRPTTLPPGGVVVVGASASGVQIADELLRSGRQVCVAVGRHTRLPRNYRGRDIFYWLNRIGLLSQPVSEMPNPTAAMRQPSLQLAGRPDRRNVDLASLQALGARLLGRLCAVDGHHVTFGGELPRTLASADEKLDRLVQTIDRHAGGQAADCGKALSPVELPEDGGAASFSLHEAGIRTVIWATGYRRSYPWLDLPILGSNGEIKHQGGVTALPGVYALGLRLLRKRDSNFIGGVGTDAEAIADQVAGFFGQRARRVA